MKINITINDELLSRVDELAKEQYMSRSGFIAQAVVNYMNQQESMKMIRMMTKAMQRIAETGTVSEETKKEFEQIQQFCQYLSLK